MQNERGILNSKIHIDIKLIAEQTGIDLAPFLKTMAAFSEQQDVHKTVKDEITVHQG